ncbi:hypothetical protein QYE76_013644 [Lolium multiflorum]|uniref:CCHC-type domain-containing protein n=1 Tax=Lolium multiflorum TaxID=4521 RepID=A0AAD8X7F0_LOLMU|nr:hypothetical protein QYE76_013644 [Lolium multiflorum]
MVKVGETSAPVVETVGPALYPRLDRKDYGLWALNMEVAMEAAEIWEAVDPGGDDYVKGGANYTKDRKALTAIYSVVPKDVMQHLVGKKSAKDAWEAIKILHQGHIRVREAHLQSLTKSYEDLKMEESETVDQFAARFVTLINAIRGYGQRLDEVKNVRRFLRAAPARYMQIVTSIEQCIDLNTLTVDDLVGRFKAHDERIRLSFDDPEQSEHLMLTKQQWMTLSKEKQGGSTSRSNGKEKQRPAKKYNAEQEEDDEAPPRRKFDIKKVRCHNCGKLGHFKSDCREPPKERAFMAQQGDDGPMMLMLEECEHMDKEELAPPVSAMEIVMLVEEKVYLHDKRGTKTGGNVWCLDTGASNHMTGDKSLFSELDLSVGGTVRFGDGSTVDIAGRGNVLLEMQYGGPKSNKLMRYGALRKSLNSLSVPYDKFVAGCIIAKLPPSWRNFATTLKHKRQEISVENPIASLDVEELGLRIIRERRGRSSANMVQKKPYSKNKGNNKPSFNKPMKTTTFKKKKMINKADLSCFTCGEAGHFSKDYPERADRKKKARQVNTVTASNADGYGRPGFFRLDGEWVTCFCVVLARTSNEYFEQSHENVTEKDDNETPKRSKRRRIEKSFGDDFIVYLVDDTPTSIAEAYASPDADDWKEAVHNEMDSILSNGTWELSERPHGCKPVGCKWVFKKKLRPDGTIEKYKARLVAKGYTQREGEDYFDTYSLSLDLPPFEYYYPWLPPMVLSFIKWT